VNWEFRQTKVWLFLLVATLTGLLLLLAVLQYRWLGQVSEAERERRQAALRVAVQRFSEDFDRELARAFVSFQLDSQTVQHKAWHEYAQRYDLWLAQAPFSRLVSAVCLITTDGVQPALSRYDHAKRRFVEQAWTPELAALHRDFEQQERAMSAGRPAPLPGEPFTLVGDFPALIIPVMIIQPLSGKPFERLIVRPEPFKAYVVVLLDQNYICGELIPALARRYFTDPSDQTVWDYHLLIVKSAQPQRVIYASGGESQAPGEPADATVNLFSLRFDLIDNFSLGGRIFSADVPPPRDEVGFAISGSPPKPLRGKAKFSVGGGFGFVMSAPAARVGPPLAATSQLPVGSETGLWQLSLRHHSGSLEKAVAQARRRNLLISFGVLLLLASSMALVLVLTVRTRRLAAQQLEFIAGVSHELRTPVSVVCMASANLADGMVRGDEQVRYYGTMLQTEGRRLSEMIEQVLDLAGTEAVRKPYQLQPVFVAEPVERALATLRQQVGVKPVTIECGLDAGLSALLADSQAIERALYNLLSNAVKYSGADCWIRVTAQQANATQLAIAVEDRGLGIEPAEVAHLFQPFWRGRAARDTNLPGNGLGLCLVDRIVRAHGGKITVASKPGQGSTFTLYLPCVTAEPVMSVEPKQYEQTSVAD
jgi:signal transduction histidine kinase